MNTQSILITGCGYVGSAVASRLLNDGFQVYALTRNPEMALKLKNLGVEVWQGPLQGNEWHSWAPNDNVRLLHTVSSASPDTEGYRLSYIEGLRSVLEWARSAEVKVALYTGSTSVYPNQDESTVDETAPTGGSDAAEILLDAEQQFLNGPWSHAFVFRLAGIYGPGRHRMLDMLRAGKAPASRGIDAWLNLVHRDDIAELCHKVMVTNPHELPSGGIYNLSDGHPSRRGEIVNWLGKRIGAEIPDETPKPTASNVEKVEPVRPTGRGANRKISNQKIKEAFDWNPRYPTFREGYEQILQLDNEA